MMNEFRVDRDPFADAVSLSVLFIDDYMEDANDAQLKIYLYLLRTLGSGAACSISALADKFNYTEKDVIRALSYWEKRGLISLTYEDKLLTAVRLLPIHPLTPGITASDAPAPAPLPEVLDAPKQAPAVSEDRTYSADEINAFKSKADTAELLFVVEQYLGRPLSRREVETLIFFMDELHFSAELIDYLFEYCLSRDKRSFGYIKKVAIAWAQDGITTPEMAAERSERYNKTVYDIMKLLGKSSTPTRVEIDYITKWTKDMDFSMDVISEACRRTVDSTDSHRFRYADAILTGWYEKKVHSPQDIQTLDQAHENIRRSTPATGGTIRKAASVPQFKQFAHRGASQNEYDLEKELLSN